MCAFYTQFGRDCRSLKLGGTRISLDASQEFSSSFLSPFLSSLLLHFALPAGKELIMKIVEVGRQQKDKGQMSQLSGEKEMQFPTAMACSQVGG